MVQYLTGGKWGLLVRRPLEAMSRTLPLIFVFFLPIGVFAKKLYLWAAIPDPEEALKQGVISMAQAHAIAFKRPMLNLTTMWISTIVCFAIWGFYMWRLNSLSLKRDADTESHVHYWQQKFENLSGSGVLIYSLTMTAGAIYWVMSLDRDVVLVDLRLALPCRPGLRRARAGHHHGSEPGKGGAVSRRFCA